MSGKKCCTVDPSQRDAPAKFANFVVLVGKRRLQAWNATTVEKKMNKSAAYPGNPTYLIFLDAMGATAISLAPHFLLTLWPVRMFHHDDKHSTTNYCGYPCST